MYQQFSDAVADILSPAEQGQVLHSTQTLRHADLNTSAKKIDILIQRYRKTYRLRPEQVIKLKDIVMEHFYNYRAAKKS